MRSRKAHLGAPLVAAVLCALMFTPAAGAKAKFPSSYSGSFSISTRTESPTTLEYTTLEATGVKLKHYKSKVILHLRRELYKFTAGQVKWHSEYNVDGCSYTLDREMPITSLTSVPPGQTPLFLSHQSYMKRGTYAIGGMFPVKTTDPVTASCTAADGGTTQQQMVPGMPPLSPWTGKRTKLPRIKGHFDLDNTEGDEVDHSSFSWDLVGH